MFKEIQQDGYTRFGISEDEICPSCYNARLIKVRIYIYTQLIIYSLFLLLLIFLELFFCNTDTSLQRLGLPLQ